MAYIYNLSDTWNAAGTAFNGIKMAITNTASASGSYMINLSTSGATTGTFTVDKSGNMSLSGTITPGTPLSPANGGTGLTTLGSGYIPYGNTTNAFNSSASFVFDGTNLGIGTGTPSTYNGLLCVKASDRAVIGYFGGTTYAVRFGANASAATIEGVDAATGVSAYRPLNVNGSTLSLQAGGSEAVAIDASRNVTVTGSGNLTIAGAGGLGYSAGSGGAVTQGSSRTTGVTLNKTNGAITLVSAAGSATAATFTVTNSTVAATDVIVLSQKSGTDKYILAVTAVAAGSFNITFYTTGGTTTEQPVFNFAVIKAVAA